MFDTKLPKQEKGEGMEQHMFFFVGSIIIAIGYFGRNRSKAVKEEQVSIPDNVVPFSRGRLRRAVAMDDGQLEKAN